MENKYGKRKFKKWAHQVPRAPVCWYASVNYISLSFLAKIEYRDIIGIDQPPDEGKDTETIKRRLFYIHPTQKGNKLEKKTLHIKTTKTEMLHLLSELKDKIDNGMIKCIGNDHLT